MPAAGLTVRRLVDCLIAIVAINANALLLHADSDFDLIAQRTALGASIRVPDAVAGSLSRL